MIDPRPDLTYDSNDWVRLLTMADAKDDICHGVLHGFRCGGLRLQRGSKGYKLRPDLDDPVSSNWTTKEAYIADRDKWLVPCTGMIMELLKKME